MACFLYPTLFFYSHCNDGSSRANDGNEKRGKDCPLLSSSASLLFLSQPATGLGGTGDQVPIPIVRDSKLGSV